MREVVIVSVARTPIGSFLGGLSKISATKLGSIAIKGALDKINLDSELIDEVFIGNVLQANLGQAPARQAALLANIPNSVPCTTINKVCASGMKAIIMGTQSIMTGDNDVVVVGGMENMSQVPHYLNTRTGNKLGNEILIDGLVKDGLTDVYDGHHMGLCAELCAEELGFSREDQDNFAKESYTKSKIAWDTGKFKKEVVSVSIPQRKGDDLIINEDEEYKKVDFDKINSISAVFKKNGTVTAANASNLNDGASALILMSTEKAKELGIKPLAKIVSYADASHEPKWFTTAPAKAIPIALKKANLSIDDIDYFEFNEAFSVVGLANMKLLDIKKSEKVNVYGGAVSLGHPLGNSGSRIVVTLISILQNNKKAKYGAASICNGGGGASAIIIEKL